MVSVRAGDTWKCQMEMWNVTPKEHRQLVIENDGGGVPALRPRAGRKAKYPAHGPSKNHRSMIRALIWWFGRPTAGTLSRSLSR
jgi:hypothetical protein